MSSDILVTEISDTLKELIRFRSTENRSSQLKQLANYVVEFFKSTGLFVKQYEFNSKPALVITTKDTLKPKIFFQGHLDVVEGDNSQFIPQTNGTRLYGRGSVDMKGFDAIVMHLLRNKSEHQANYNVGVMLTFDEEIGGKNGALQLRKLGYDCDCLINGDAGYHHALIYAEKGILKLKIKVKAKPGRHPFPWQGENAFDILIQNYNKITSLFPYQNKAADADNWYTTYSSYDVRVENDALFYPKSAEMKLNIYFTESVSADEYF
ncbi:M20 family metallopeptidase [candidate division KSB1 bacterium]|nr:M20 family metallopeptidase [candidate division KSB1 bacterium]